MTTNGKQYLDYSESVKMLREALKRNFPGVKFSVHKSYQRGTSVRVEYALGPQSEKVNRVAQRFHGADFDGMTDSTSYTTDILVAADGSTRVVSHGIHFVFVDRDIPQAYYDAVVAKLGETWEPKQWAEYKPWDKERMAREGLCKLDIPATESIDSVATRAVAAFFGEVVAS